MRALVLLSVAVLACLPLAGAAPNPVPSLTIKIDQASLSVNASNASQPVTFTGSVTVSKSQYLSATVTLSAAVAAGWNSSVSPSSMTFTTTSPQSFTCTVVVPAATPGGNESQLTVSGTVVSGFLQSGNEATAMVRVVGTLPPPAHQSGNGTGGTKPSGGNNQTSVPTGLVSNPVSAGFLGYSYEQWAYITVAAVAIVVVAGAAVRVRRRRRAPLEVESVEES
jgi:hypothetical protein